MGRLDDLKEEIYQLAVPICESLGIEIVEMHVHPYNETINIQIFADRPTGGIGIDECTQLNRRLDEFLFNELKLGNNYTLEVSSPGLDRNLVNYRDFRRIIGRDVHVFLKEAVRGRREVEGRLTGVRESEILLQIGREEWMIPMDKIEKGKQII